MSRVEFSYTVKLPGAGTVTVSALYDDKLITDDERALIRTMIARLMEHAAPTVPPADAGRRGEGS